MNMGVRVEPVLCESANKIVDGEGTFRINDVSLVVTSGAR